MAVAVTRVRRQIDEAGAVPSHRGSPPPPTSPKGPAPWPAAEVLVFARQRALVPSAARYRIHRPDGTDAGTVREVRGRWHQRPLRLLAAGLASRRFEVVDAGNTPLAAVHKPWWPLRGEIRVAAPGGDPLAVIRQRPWWSRRFEILLDGEHVATLAARNVRAWEFVLAWPEGGELGRVTKVRDGVIGAVFTAADTYVLRFDAAISDPLRSAVMATPLLADLSLSQYLSA